MSHYQRWYATSVQYLGLMVMVCLMWLPGSSLYAAWLVVANQQSQITPLSANDVRVLFTNGQVQGHFMQLLDLANESLRSQFYASVVGVTPNQWRAHWAKQVFTGQQPLPQQLSIDEAVRFVQTHQDAVAYIPDDLPLAEHLKVIYCSPKDELTLGVTNCRAYRHLTK